MQHRAKSGVTAGVTLVLLAIAALSAQRLFRHQASIARDRIGKPLGEQALAADRVWRKSLEGEPMRLLLLGDSLAAGLGAERRKETLGARLAKGLARRMQRPVRLHTAAKVGAESHELEGQLDTLPEAYRPDIAVIVVGGNDVTHLNAPASAARHLEQAIIRLREMGAEVVVGTCPDLGALRSVPQPLRAVISRMSWHMSVVQRRAARRQGASVVSLRNLVGPIFRAEPGEMFSVDSFHPSAAGYRRTADALLPAMVAMLR